MRISDWSSDVCSSDLPVLAAPRLYGVDCAVPHGAAHRRLRRVAEREAEPAVSAGRSVARLVCRDLHRRRLAWRALRLGRPRGALGRPRGDHRHAAHLVTGAAPGPLGARVPGPGPGALPAAPGTHPPRVPRFRRHPRTLTAP